jgi:hypothetical protein
MTDNLRDRIAEVLFMRDDPTAPRRYRGYAELPAEIQELWRVEADPIIAILPDHFQPDELVRKRIDNIRQICVASMNLDRDDPSSDRRWLADSILNILNGMTDE